MSDNVIIFGAGASADAGIPLMAGFVEKMWKIAKRKRIGEEKLTTEDNEIFSRIEDCKGRIGDGALECWKADWLVVN